MADFPESAKDISNYFETNHIGIRRPYQTRRIPPFPVCYGTCMSEQLQDPTIQLKAPLGWTKEKRV